MLRQMVWAGDGMGLGGMGWGGMGWRGRGCEWKEFHQELVEEKERSDPGLNMEDGCFGDLRGE